MEYKKNYLAPIILAIIFLVILGLGIALYFYFSRPVTSVEKTNLSPKTSIQTEPPPASDEDSKAKPQPTEISPKLLGIHDVIRGDTLWWISDKWYKDPVLWPYIFEINRSLIKDPDQIYPGQRFDIPAFSGSANQLSPQDYALLSQGYLEAYRIYKEKGVKSANDYRILGERYNQKAKQ